MENVVCKMLAILFRPLCDNEGYLMICFLWFKYFCDAFLNYENPYYKSGLLFWILAFRIRMLNGHLVGTGGLHH